ncbi:hypothetical protein [uncultured Jatrophihabitans sp.]|uniref:hypothetical protein n=1 Tax=uncultured Jatrophihabitans sp. TaxID=1610747 RepID=UPI0035CB4C0F
MTARIGSTSMDGTPISDTDRARIEAEDQLHFEQRRSAVRVIAAASKDADDCRTLLSMLGLADDVVAAARTHRSSSSAAPSTAKRSRKRSVAA